MIAERTELDFVLRRLEGLIQEGLARHEKAEPGPIRELHLELTHRCNLRCVMCHHWQLPLKEPARARRELDAGLIERVVSESRLLDSVENVVLTGGEPWLRPDITDIAAALARRFPVAGVGILTNMWDHRALLRGLDELRRRGLRKLWLGTSLDGLEQAHDRNRGRRGAFRALLRSVRLLRREHPDVHFSFNFTITPGNRADLWPAYALARDLGVGFGAQLVVEHEGFEAPGRFSWRAGMLEDVQAQIGRILLDICRREGALRRILEGREGESRWLWSRLLYWHYLARYVRAPGRFFRNCLAGRRYAMLDPEGRLFFCPVNKHRKVGDVRAEGFDDAWTSAAARRERRFVDSGRCHCWLACIANPVLDSVLSGGG